MRLRDELQAILGNDLVAMRAHGGTIALDGPPRPADLDTYVIVRHPIDERTSQRIEGAQSRDCRRDRSGLGRLGRPRSRMPADQSRLHTRIARIGATRHGRSCAPTGLPAAMRTCTAMSRPTSSRRRRGRSRGRPRPRAGAYRGSRGRRRHRSLRGHLRDPERQPDPPGPRGRRRCDLQTFGGHVGARASPGSLARDAPCRRPCLRWSGSPHEAAELLADDMAPFVAMARERLPSAAGR